MHQFQRMHAIYLFLFIKLIVNRLQNAAIVKETVKNDGFLHLNAINCLF